MGMVSAPGGNQIPAEAWLTQITYFKILCSGILRNLLLFPSSFQAKILSWEEEGYFSFGFSVKV